MGGTKPPGWTPPPAAPDDRLPVFVRAERPPGRRVLCLSCWRELRRPVDMDPATPLQYCAAEACQKVSADHDRAVSPHRMAGEIQRWNAAAAAPESPGADAWWQ